MSVKRDATPMSPPSHSTPHQSVSGGGGYFRCRLCQVSSGGPCLRHHPPVVRITSLPLTFTSIFIHLAFFAPPTCRVSLPLPGNERWPGLLRRPKHRRPLPGRGVLRGSYSQGRKAG